MPAQSRGRQAIFTHSRSAPDLPPLGVFSITPASTSDEQTPRALGGPEQPPPPHASSTDDENENEDDEADEADFQSHYSLDAPSSSESSDSDSQSDDGLVKTENKQRPYLHHSSNSSFLSANAFAPPFYNKPPTPLPPSPSLTSLLRPSFSAQTSRPTTPDSSENDTPNDTEAAVAKSARTATTVPRASPKVPTYEYYGFVLYLMSCLSFGPPPLFPSCYITDIPLPQSCTFYGPIYRRHSFINLAFVTTRIAGGPWLSPPSLS